MRFIKIQNRSLRTLARPFWVCRSHVQVPQSSARKMDQRSVLQHGQLVRVRTSQGWGGDARSGDGKRTLIVLDQGDLIQPSRGKPQPPAPLDSEPIDASSNARSSPSWRIGSPVATIPTLARAIANRVWANFMGHGLVEAIDDMRTSNPASARNYRCWQLTSTTPSST